MKYPLGTVFREPWGGSQYVLDSLADGAVMFWPLGNCDYPKILTDDLLKTVLVHYLPPNTRVRRKVDGLIFTVNGISNGLFYENVFMELRTSDISEINNHRIFDHCSVSEFDEKFEFV